MAQPAASAPPAKSADELRTAMRSIVQAKDPQHTTLRSLRRDLEQHFGLQSGALDPQKDMRVCGVLDASALPLPWPLVLPPHGFPQHISYFYKSLLHLRHPPHLSFSFPFPFSLSLFVLSPSLSSMFEKESKNYAC